ncbi:rCG24501 [Rattus norvegicus]|uniref:RCG24501 n=1 Tax=Rattus norvegicus TaxID=10116 RepID=A6KJB7_RAT|nr:rCG24501 [Rattus norvegicus]
MRSSTNPREALSLPAHQWCLSTGNNIVLWTKQDVPGKNQISMASTQYERKYS